MSEAAAPSIQVDQRGSTFRVTLGGRVDIGSAHRLLTDLEEQIPADAQRVELDLSGVDYFDSGGGTVIIGLRQRLAKQGGQLEIVASTPAIDGFLELIDDEHMTAAQPRP